MSSTKTELFYDDSPKLETTANGVLSLRYAFDTDNYITCNNSANTMEFVLNNTDIGEFSGSGLMIRDSMQLRVGTGNDLKLFHDGSNSMIENDTGILRIIGKTGQKIDFCDDNYSTYYARMNSGQGVQLYYNLSLIHI